MRERFVAKDIINYLDNCVIDQPYCVFMNLGPELFYTANSRLTLYADEWRWAIVLEQSGYQNRLHGIELELHFFGNCLYNMGRTGADDRRVRKAKFKLVDCDALNAVAWDFDQVSLAASAVKVRGESVPIPSTKAGYAKWIPDIEDDEDFLKRPAFWDLARFLAFEYFDLCRATDVEKRLCLPRDLPEIMTVEEWHHRFYAYYSDGPDNGLTGNAPSTYETFPLIAEVLATRDRSRFRPTLPPTSHWSNWPEAARFECRSLLVA